MKIAISGLSGCGNTTTSTVLSKKLGFPLVNFTFRNLAKEKGMSLEELSEKAKYNSDIDKELDIITQYEILYRNYGKGKSLIVDSEDN